MNKPISVLDHGYVRLIDSMGSDLPIARNARLSYDAAWRAGEDTNSDHRLLSYLYKNGHNTPFESVVFTFEVKAPIFVIRQWQRHRTQSYNEISARYKELPEEYYIPDPTTLGEQSKSNKQMRTINEKMTTDDLAKAEYSCYTMEQACKNAFTIYAQLIKSGVPRELARSVLPFSTYSHMFTTVNLHNLLKFLKERIHPHAQYEIQVYAKAILELITPIVPETVRLFQNERNS